MNMIVAVDENWAIGNKGELLVHIPNDMKMFRQETTGKVVVLGRKTMETFPQKKPLPNRTNIIMSRNKDYKVTDAIVVDSVEALLEELKNYNDEEIYIIGGDSIFQHVNAYSVNRGTETLLCVAVFFIPKHYLFNYARNVLNSVRCA